MREHRQDDRITRVKPITWNDEATCNPWAGLLRVLGQLRRLYDSARCAVGYTLASRTDDQCLLFRYCTSVNGKSVFEDTRGALLGECGTATQCRKRSGAHSGTRPHDLCFARRRCELQK